MKLAIAIALAVGCGGTRDDGAKGDELEGAKLQVHRFFDALAKRDCATLASLLPEATDATACAKLLHEWNEDLQARLIEVPGAQRDGRDARALIVRAVVAKHGTQSTMLVRVTHEQGAWRLVL